MKTMKKLWLMVAALSVTTLLCVISASACTMVYVGSDYTADGSTFMARSEDYSNSYNKIAYVSQHGKHAAGRRLRGLLTALPTPSPTHSYAYTAVSDDQHLRRRPDCDGTHAHTPMEECGTNEKGVSVLRHGYAERQQRRSERPTHGQRRHVRERHGHRSCSARPPLPRRAWICC